MATSVPLLTPAILGVVVLTSVLVHPGAHSAAQVPAATAEQYVSSAIVGRNDVSGYRLVNTGPLSLASGSVFAGALAGRFAVFDADPIGAPRVPTFRTRVAAFPDVTSPAQFIDGVRDDGMFIEPDGAQVSVRWDGPVTGVDQGESFRFTRTHPDRLAEAGSGVAWRRGTVLFIIDVVSAPGHETMPETLRLANLQNDKAIRVGPFVLSTQPPPSPTPQSRPVTAPAPIAGGGPAQPPPTAGDGTEQPPLLLLAVAQVNGAIVRDGTVIRAFINGTECARELTVFGWTFLIVASKDTIAGCGAPGATVMFTIDDAPAKETVAWVTDSFARGLMLTAGSNVARSDLAVRQVVNVVCLPEPGHERCTDTDRLLWDGNLAAWLARFLERGQAPELEALLLAWAKFRAEREEVLGSIVAAFLEKRSHSFVNAVRFQPSDDAPNVYVEIATYGADRPVGGWQVRTSDDGVYAFPDGAVLRQGLCRIYLHADASEGDSTNQCPGAVLQGGSLDHPGAVYLLDDGGEIVDSLGF